MLAGLRQEFAERAPWGHPCPPSRHEGYPTGFLPSFTVRASPPPQVRISTRTRATGGSSAATPRHRVLMLRSGLAYGFAIASRQGREPTVRRSRGWPKAVVVVWRCLEGDPGRRVGRQAKLHPGDPSVRVVAPSARDRAQLSLSGAWRKGAAVPRNAGGGGGLPVDLEKKGPGRRPAHIRRRAVRQPRIRKIRVEKTPKAFTGFGTRRGVRLQSGASRLAGLRRVERQERRNR